MNHEGEGEIAEEGRVLPCPRRRVTFRNDSENGVHYNGDSDDKPLARCISNGKDVNGHKQQTSACNGSSDASLCDADKKKSSREIVGILRPRSISPSPLVFEALLATKPRFKLSKLWKAMRRSNETRGLIEKLKKQILQRLEHQQRDSKTNIAHSSHSHSLSKHCTENGEKQPLSLVNQERRMVCLQSTKAMMNQSLPPSMMPFVEETLKAAHFLHRRRKENGHGRIVHKILIEQHKKILKELEQSEDRNGETSHSSWKWSHKTEPS